MIEIRAIAVGLSIALMFAGGAGRALAQTPTVQSPYGSDPANVEKYSTGTTGTIQDLLSSDPAISQQLKSIGVANPGVCSTEAVDEITFSPPISFFGNTLNGIKRTNITLRVGLELASIDEAVDGLGIDCVVCRGSCEEQISERDTTLGSYPKIWWYGFTNSAGTGYAACNPGNRLWPTTAEINIYRLIDDDSVLQSIDSYHCRLFLNNPEELSASPGRTTLTPSWAWAKAGTELIAVLEGKIDAAIVAPSLIFEPPPAVETTSSVETSPAVISPTISAPTILSPPTTQ